VIRNIVQLMAVVSLWSALAPGCATFPAVGRGGTVYGISVLTVDGHPTADRGSAAYPACTLQVGTVVARVWLAYESHVDAVSPVIIEGDAEALKDGVLVERSWNEAVVYKVTEEDLQAGGAVVYVPSLLHAPTVIELRFLPVPKGVPSANRQHNLPERRTALQ
jgi:hypothetical protein